MANGKKLIRILYFLIGITFYNCISLAMAEKPYHHLPDGTFRNPEGSPVRSKDVKFSYTQFNKEKKKIEFPLPTPVKFSNFELTVFALSRFLKKNGWDFKNPNPCLSRGRHHAYPDWTHFPWLRQEPHRFGNHARSPSR